MPEGSDMSAEHAALCSNQEGSDQHAPYNGLLLCRRVVAHHHGAWSPLVGKPHGRSCTTLVVVWQLPTNLGAAPKLPNMGTTRSRSTVSLCGARSFVPEREQKDADLRISTHWQWKAFEWTSVVKPGFCGPSVGPPPTLASGSCHSPGASRCARMGTFISWPRRGRLDAH